jgi:hypothetical protein
VLEDGKLVAGGGVVDILEDDAASTPAPPATPAG